jgi:hypothetical protein
MRRFRITIVVVEKQSVTCSDCVLLIQHAKRMRHITSSYVVCLSLPYFSTLAHKRHDFQKNVAEHNFMCDFFPTNLVWKISHSTKN